MPSPFHGRAGPFSNKSNANLFASWRWNTNLYFMSAMTEPLARGIFRGAPVIFEIKFESHSSGWLARPISLKQKMIMSRSFSGRGIHFKLGRNLRSARYTVKHCLPSWLFPCNSSRWTFHQTFQKWLASRTEVNQSFSQLYMVLPVATYVAALVAAVRVRYAPVRRHDKRFFQLFLIKCG